MSSYALMLTTGLTLAQVKAALTRLVCRSGGVVAVRGDSTTLYKLYQKTKPKPEPIAGDEYKIAGKITIPQFRYGGTRLG